MPLHSVPVRRLPTAVRNALPLALMSVAPVALAQDNTTALDALVVTDTALKVEAPLVETPRPASVVEREELDERNVQSLDETFRYRAGVLSGMYGADNDTDWFKVRGFDQSTYQDGLRIYREGYYQWLPEPYGIERVELLKGPASILYGEAPPGGVINVISKRPTDEPQGQIQVQAGNREHRQVAFDNSGELADDARYRIVSLYKYREGDINKTENERYYVAPSFEFDIGEKTLLTILASFQKDDAIPTNSFKTKYGTVEDTPYGKIAPKTNLGEPGYDQNNREQAAIGYELRHEFNETWTFEQKARYNRLDLDLRSSYAFFMVDGRHVDRGIVYRNGCTRSWAIDNHLIGNFYTDRTENTLLIGVDYQNLGTNGKELPLMNEYPFGQPLDVFDPVYGNYAPVDPSLLITRDIDKQQTGVYLQDQLRIDDRWILLGSVRYDHSKTDNLDVTNDELKQANDDEVTWSGGMMYLAENGISPYLSYSESFEPQTQTDEDGRLYDPITGKQYEAGVKYAPRGLDGYVTAAVFDITQKNSLVTPPSGGIQVQAGEQQSRGFELEGIAYLTPQLQMTAAYTYTDSETKDKANETESRVPLIPRHMASAWLDYAFESLAPGLKIGGGARYVGESKDGATVVDSYTVFDFMAGYDINEHWSTQLNVNNVTDKEYIASCNFWCYYGESRSIIGSISYNW